MDIREILTAYIKKVFTSFGASVFIIGIIALILGDKVSGVSTLFALGSGGLGIGTMAQFFLLNVILNAAEIFFLSDFAAKKFSVTLRTAMMTASAFLCAVLFAALFCWFRTDDIAAWICFIISFSVVFAVYISATAYKEKKKNSELNEALRKLKEEM